MNFDLTEEQKTWKKIVHDFVAKVVKPKAQEVDEKEEFNWDAVQKGGPLGLLGMSISEAYGGSNVDMISSWIAMGELGWGCGSPVLALTARNGLGTPPITL